MTFDINSLNGKVLSMYTGTNLIQRGTIISTSIGNIVKFDRDSLYSPGSNLVNTINIDSSYANVTNTFCGEITFQKYTTTHTVDLCNIVQTNSVKISFSFAIKVEIYDVATETWFMPAVTGIDTDPCKYIKLELFYGGYAGTVFNGTSNIYTGEYTGNVCGDLTNINERKNGDVRLIASANGQYTNTTPVRMTFTLSHITYTDCNGDDIVDGDKCLLIGTYTG
jgi:hypothetical protein